MIGPERRDAVWTEERGTSDEAVLRGRKLVRPQRRPDPADLRDALHAEWTKLRTLPGTGWLLLAVVALTVSGQAPQRPPPAAAHPPAAARIPPGSA